MRTPSLLVSLSLLASAPACESSGSGSESGSGGERSVEEWIELCESQQNRNDCDAVSSGMRGSETWRCEFLLIVQTDESDCISIVNDSRCFAVSDSPSEAGYIFAEPGTMQTWLIEPPPDATVYGSAIESCVLADDGVSWEPATMCACTGMVADETGA